MENHHGCKKKPINGPCSLAMYDDCMILDVFWNIFWLLYYFVPDTVGYLLHISPCVLINPPLRFSPIVSWLGSPRNGGVLYCAPPFLWDNYDKGGTLCPEKNKDPNYMLHLLDNSASFYHQRFNPGSASFFLMFYRTIEPCSMGFSYC